MRRRGSAGAKFEDCQPRLLGRDCSRQRREPVGWVIRPASPITFVLQRRKESAMSEPRRIQRKREKGWRMPANTIYVGGPTIFENPFKGSTDAVTNYAAWLGPYGESLFPSLKMKRYWLLNGLSRLRGKNLSCWCPLDQPCHADVLLELANA